MHMITEEISGQQVFPIQSLQPEILALIFSHCLPELDKSSYRSIMSSEYAPLLLCNVCSSWRNLAISAPQLWQTFDFVIRSPSFKLDKLDAESLAIGTHTWLARSGTLPLTIRLGVLTEYQTFFEHVFEPLLQYTSRWETCYFGEIWKLPRSQKLDTLPILREIEITSSRIPFTSAPCLKSLSLLSLQSNSKLPLTVIPSDQLTDLAIQADLLPSAFFHIMRHCHRLQSLSLRLSGTKAQPLPFTLGIGGQEVSSGSLIQHDTLRCLNLVTSYPPSPLEFINCPSLIELSYLHYTLVAGRPLSFWPLLSDFFNRSSCQLKKLSLNYVQFSVNELSECLHHQSCQTLTDLALVYGRDNTAQKLSKETLLHLTYSEDNKMAPICPKLAHLVLRFCYSSSTIDLLGRMVQSRCFGRAPDDRLKSLTVESFRELSKKDYDLLVLARKGGLDLVYEYPHMYSPPEYDY